MVELVNGAQHDRQKFYVEAILAWRTLENGNFELRVKWRGFEETWEPIETIFEDVPEKVQKFVRDRQEPLLDRELARLQAAAAAATVQ